LDLASISAKEILSYRTPRASGIYTETLYLRSHIRYSDATLHSILEFTALAKNLDQVSQDDNQVPIVIVHQASGLEFDSVFIAGATGDEFPSFLVSVTIN